MNNVFSVLVRPVTRKRPDQLQMAFFGRENGLATINMRLLYVLELSFTLNWIYARLGESAFL